MLKEFTCIICPNGCDIRVTLEEEAIRSVEGNLCPRGEAYVRQELLAPQRTIASSVLVEGGILPLASVRLDRAIPRERIFDVMAEIRKVKLEAPVRIGQVVIENVLGLGSNVIITKNVPAKEDC